MGREENAMSKAAKAANSQYTAKAGKGATDDRKERQLIDPNATRLVRYSETDASPQRVPSSTVLKRAR